MVPHHESITLVDASGTLINQLEGWGLEHQGLGLWKGCILRRGEGHSKKLRSCFMGDSPSSGLSSVNEVRLTMFLQGNPVWGKEHNLSVHNEEGLLPKNVGGN